MLNLNSTKNSLLKFFVSLAPAAARREMLVERRECACERLDVVLRVRLVRGSVRLCIILNPPRAEQAITTDKANHIRPTPCALGRTALKGEVRRQRRRPLCTLARLGCRPRFISAIAIGWLMFRHWGVVALCTR